MLILARSSSLTPAFWAISIAHASALSTLSRVESRNRSTVSVPPPVLIPMPCWPKAMPNRIVTINYPCAESQAVGQVPNLPERLESDFETAGGDLPNLRLRQLDGAH